MEAKELSNKLAIATKTLHRIRNANNTNSVDELSNWARVALEAITGEVEEWGLVEVELTHAKKN